MVKIIPSYNIHSIIACYSQTALTSSEKECLTIDSNFGWLSAGHVWLRMYKVHTYFTTSKMV